MKYREFLNILLAYGFQHKRTTASHHFYEGWVDGKRCLVNLDYSSLNDDIWIRNFQSMVRTSGLPKRVFKKGK